MSAMSFSDADTYLDPTPAWRFTTTLPSISGSLLDGQLLTFYVERFSAPIPGINFEPAAFNSGERQFPNMRTIDVISIVLAENTKFDVIRYLRAWKNLVIDDQGNYGMPAVYKKSIQLEPLDAQGNSNITLSWSGAAPSRVDPLDFDGSASRHMTCSVSFVVDQADPLNGSSLPTATPFQIGG